MAEKLWVDRDIPIIALAGETSAGKSLFPILCTDTWQNHGAEPDVVVFDAESSVETYRGSMNFQWLDIRAFLAEGVHRQIMRSDATDPNWRKILLGKADVNDSPAASVFRATYLSLLKIDPGTYRVGSFDTFTPFQAGCVEWLRAHPEAFGRTEKQYTSASSMFLWPDVKAMLTYILTVDCRLRFETFVLTLHMKNEWKSSGGSDARKTGERIAEGLDLIDKVATLYATLDRRPRAKSKHAPEVPSGLVVFPHGKSRLVSLVDGKLRPTLPPRVPQFTPQAIREYIVKPADYDNLKADERLPDDSLSDDQRLMINADIARNQAMAAEAETAKLEMVKRAAAMVTGGQAVQSTATQQSAVVESQPVASDLDAAATASPAGNPITEAQSAEVKARWGEVWDSPAAFCGFLKERFGVDKPKMLSESQATELILHIVEFVSKKNATAIASALNAESNSTQPVAANTGETLPATTNAATAVSHSDVADAESAAAGDPPVTTEASEFATREQIERIRDLAGKANWAREKQTEWLNRRGVNSFRSVTAADAQSLIERLAKTVSEFEQQGTPGN